MKAEDAYGNTSTGYTGTITFSSTDSSGDLPGNYSFVGGDKGIHTFSGGVVLKTAGEQTVAATDAADGSLSGSQADITVTAAPANMLEVSGISDPVTAGTPSSVTVRAVDAFGNIDIAYTGTVTFSSTDAAATLPANYTFVAEDQGVRIFPSGVTLRSSGEHSVTSTDTVNGTIAGTQSDITVTPAGASRLVVSGIADPVVAGTPSDITIKAVDAFANTDTNYVGTVVFSSTDTATALPQIYAFITADRGSRTFAAGVVLTTVGEQSVTVDGPDDPNNIITGTQSDITVTPAPATNLVVSGVADPVTAGVASDVTVKAEDSFGNTATGYTGTVSFTSTDNAATLPANYTFPAADNGTHSFSAAVVLKTVGEHSVTVTDTADAGITGDQGDITVNAGPASSLAVAGIDDPVTVGTPTDMTVTALDTFGNTDTNYTGTVTFSSSDPAATLPGDYTFAPGEGGIHTFTGGVAFGTAGEQSVTATDSADPTITGAQRGITVRAAADVRLVVSDISDPVTAGAPSDITVRAMDAPGSTDASYRGTITFTSSDAAATLPADYTFVGADNGSHTFSGGIVLKTAGERFVTATDISDSTITGTRSGITVTPGPASRLSVSGISDPATAGAPSDVTVRAVDSFGNTDTNYRSTVIFSSTEAFVTLPSSYTFVESDGGSHFFPGVILRTAGEQSVTATDTANPNVSGT